MGMYDEVIVYYDLPNDEKGLHKDTIFQTKNFKCSLSTYVITSDGKLRKGDTYLNFDGKLVFYSFGCEYLANFKSGQLESINRLW